MLLNTSVQVVGAGGRGTGQSVAGEGGATNKHCMHYITVCYPAIFLYFSQTSCKPIPTRNSGEDPERSANDIKGNRL